MGVRVSFSSQSLKLFAEIAQLVEHNLAKVRVASSSLVFRSCFFEIMELSFAQVAELVDVLLCEDSGSYVVGVKISFSSQFMKVKCGNSSVGRA